MNNGYGLASPHYNRWIGELWLWMLFVEWIYYSITLEKCN